jgi:hypothetical protein
MLATSELISKEAVLKSISEIPTDRVSIEELFDRIIYLYKIEIGLARSHRREGMSIESIREKMKSWKRERLS